MDASTESNSINTMDASTESNSNKYDSCFD